MKRNKSRAKGQTSLTISLPTELKEEWSAEAERQHRNASNLFVLVAEKYLSGRLQEVPETQGNIITPAQNNVSGAGEARPLKYKIRKQA